MLASYKIYPHVEVEMKVVEKTRRINELNMLLEGKLLIHPLLD